MSKFIQKKPVQGLPNNNSIDQITYQKSLKPSPKRNSNNFQSFTIASQNFRLGKKLRQISRRKSKFLAHTIDYEADKLNRSSHKSRIRLQKQRQIQEENQHIIERIIQRKVKSRNLQLKNRYKTQNEQSQQISFKKNHQRIIPQIHKKKKNSCMLILPLLNKKNNGFIIAQ